MIGITVGFAVGLGLIYGMEHVMELIEEANESAAKEHIMSYTPVSAKTYPKVEGDDADMIEEGNALRLMRRNSMDEEESGDWEAAPVERSIAAMSQPDHRLHIQQHLEELRAAITGMEDKSASLLNKELVVSEAEAVAESIDEEIHSLQYKLDHCRRSAERRHHSPC